MDIANMPNTISSRASKSAALAPATGGHVGKLPFAVDAVTADLGARELFFGEQAETSGRVTGLESDKPAAESGWMLELRSRRGEFESRRAHQNDALNACPANDNAPERWLPISGHTGYEVSEGGLVRHGQRVLATYVARDGYRRISLRRDGDKCKRSHAVHLLVADAFLGPCPDGYEVDHLSGDKTDPRLTNLEFVTHSENMRRALARGQLVPVRGERHGMSKLDTEKVQLAIRLLGEGLTNSDVGARLGVANQTISQIRRGEIWGHVTGLPRLPRRHRLLPAARPANTNGTEGSS